MTVPGMLVMADQIDTAAVATAVAMIVSVSVVPSP